MAKAKKVVEVKDEAPKVEAKKSKYVVVQSFIDALIPSLLYSEGEDLPDDISEDRIQIMLDNTLTDEL